MNKKINGPAGYFFIVWLILMICTPSSATAYEDSYPPDTEEGNFEVPIGGSFPLYVEISDQPDNAVITDVEAKFDYIAYGVVQDYVSVRFNKGSDPGSSGGQTLVNQGSLPSGNPGTYGYQSVSSAWDGESVNDKYYFNFSVASGSPYTCTIKKVYVRITYAIPSIEISYPSGGEVLTKGENYTIRWTSNNVTGDVLIHLYKGGSYHKTIAASTFNDGKQSFTPYDDIADGSDYSIGISAIDVPASKFSEDFTIQSPALIIPSPPSLISPSGNVEYGNDISFSWNQSSDANRYRLKICTDASMTHQISGSPFEPEAGETSYTLSGSQFSYGHTYYWQVGAIGNDESAGWGEYGPSSPWSVTITSSIDPQVSVSPSTGPQGTTFSQPGINFTPETQVNLYFNGPDGTSTAYEYTDVNGNYEHSWVCNDCPAGQYSYYAVDNATGISSNTINFTVTEKIEIDLLEPTQHSEVTDTGIEFRWSDVGAVRYELYVDNNSGLGSPEISMINIDALKNYTGTSYELEDIWIPRGEYSWKVYAYFDDGSFIESSTGTFSYLPPVSEEPVWTALYRLYDSDSNDHYYTTIATHRDNAVSSGYAYEKIECWLADRPFDDTGCGALFHLYNEGENIHFYTSDGDKKDEMINSATGDYTYEGIVGFLYTSAQDDMVPLAHLEHVANTDHFYTINQFEKENAVSVYGFSDQGYEGYVFATGLKEQTAHSRPQANLGGIDLGSGAFRGLNSHDLMMKGPGPSLCFAHYYNSFNFNDYPMGQGWSHTLYSTILENNETGEVFVNWGNGSISWFSKNDGQYTDETGNHDFLELVNDGINYGYNLTRKDQTVYQFRMIGNQYFYKIVLIGIEDWAGNKLTFDHSASNAELLSVSDNFGRKLVFGYNTSGQIITVEEKVNDITKRSIFFTYNTKGLLETFTNASGKVTSYAYYDDDESVKNNLLESIEYPKGNTIIIDYDEVSRQVTSVQKDGASSSVSYEPQSNMTTFSDPAGNVYQALHNDYKIMGLKTASDENFTTFLYDDPVNPLQPTEMVDKKQNVTSYEYDDMGNCIQITNARGKIALFTYNTDCGKNNIKTSTDFHTKETDIKQTVYTYDMSGNRLISVKNPEDETVNIGYHSNNLIASVENGEQKTTWFEYDDYGNLNKVIDAENNETRYENDYAGRTIAVIDAEDVRTEFNFTDTDKIEKTTYMGRNLSEILSISNSYDDNGNPEAVYWTNDGITCKTSYNYDDKDRLESIINPVDKTTLFTYYDNNQIHTRQDANNIVTSYVYEENNLTKEVDYPGTAEDVSITRDQNGNMTCVNGKNGDSNFEYNALNQIKTYTDPYGNTVEYAYNDAGRIETITYPGEKNVTYGYDNAGRLETVQDWLGGITTYVYDDAGNVTGITRPNGTRAIYAYDDASRLKGITEEKADSTIICSYEFNLDGVGNHRSVTATEPLATIVPATDISYSYDSANRLESAGSITYTYDNNGNRKTRSDTGTSTYTWNYENLLTEISQTDSSQTVQYHYDAMGNRIAGINGDTTTRYILDPTGSMTRVLAQADENNVIRAYYIYGIGLINRIEPDDTRKFYHYNHLGSTIALTDSAENICDAYAYDEYGKLLESTGTTENPFKFVGKYGVMDEGNNLYFMRARFYDAEVGRFLSEDPLGFDGGDWNLYAYVRGNPITRIDPAGKGWLDVGSKFYKYTSWADNANVLFWAKGINTTASLAISISGVGWAVPFVIAINAMPVIYKMGTGELSSKDALSELPELLLSLVSIKASIYLAKKTSGIDFLHTKDWAKNKQFIIDGLGAMFDVFNSINDTIDAVNEFHLKN